MNSKSRKAHRGRKIGTALLILAMCAMIGSYFAITASVGTVYTITDGHSSVDVSSRAASVEQVLAEAGITVNENDLVTTTGGSSKTYIFIQRSQNITIEYCGQSLSATTYGTTVGALLEEMNIDLSSGSTVTSSGCPVSIAEETYDGMTLTVDTTTAKSRSELVSVPYETVTYQDSTLDMGVTQVQTPGVPGTNQLIYEDVYSNGTLQSSTLTATRVMTEPVDEVILVGCKETPVTDDIPLEVYVEPEPEPEPEHEPEPVSSKPTYSAPKYEEPEYSEPEYSAPSYSQPDYTDTDYSGNTITTASGDVISYSYSLSVTATAYTGGGTTATGTAARYGAIAVDPSVIPYGTRMYIVSDDGKYIYGYATAEDCGGAIKGNIIDLYFDSYDTCIQFGRRSCTVYILD